MTFSAPAQQSTFTYDAAGNTVAIAGTGSAAPAITAPPQTQLLEPNQSVSFSVAATGLGNAYQWLCNGVAIFGASNNAKGYILQ
jgi:hypothetical protein